MSETTHLLSRQIIHSLNRKLVCYVLGQHNPQKAVLLYIHGGPGYGGSRNTALALLTQMPEILEHYTVVLYDQRCAGESLVLRDLVQTLSVEDHLRDGHQVISRVLADFDIQKLIVCGHSWGTHLGLKLALRYPQQVQAYIGIGQVISGLAGEQESYRLALRHGHSKVPEMAGRLKLMGPPPHLPKHRLSYLLLHRKIIAAVGGFQRSGGGNSDRKNLWQKFTTTVASLRIQAAMSRSVTELWQECLDVDFSANREYPFPLFFICGKYDFITPTRLVIKKFRQLNSRANLQIFDGTAHRPHLEDSARFSRFLLDKHAELTGESTQADRAA